MKNKNLVNESVFSLDDDPDFCIIRNNRVSIDELLVDETIFAQFNGVLGSRGHFVEGYGGDLDQPQTFINGFYNTYPYHYEENSPQFPQSGQTIVNLPDASLMKLSAEGEEINSSFATLTELTRCFDLRRGYVSRIAKYSTFKGFDFVVCEEKIVSVTNRNLIITKMTIESTNYQGFVKVMSFLKMPEAKKILSTDPRVSRPGKHLNFLKTEIQNRIATLKAETEHTDLVVEVGITHDTDFIYHIDKESVFGVAEFLLKPNQKFSVTKYQYFNASHVDSHVNLFESLSNMLPFDYYRETQEAFARNFWLNNEVYINDPMLIGALRYNIYQLNLSGGILKQLQIAAKGISGEGYEGHYFWDTEIYMMPYFILNDPQKARNLLMYRYLNLPQSRVEARKLGVNRGAKIPWRTISGDETSPYYPAGSAQIHINSDLAYAIMQYYHATGDNDFMYEAGFEIMLETALFLLDYGFFDKKGFHLCKVTGPDEYTVLVNDNFYTNRMAEHHFDAVVEFYNQNKSKLMSILRKLNVNQEDLDDLNRASRQMTYFTEEGRGLILQDESFLNLKDLDLAQISMDMRPMLLNYHPLFIYRHQVLKQADTILALVLMNDCYKAIYRKTFEYYLKRTTHDSSLSKCIYGIAAYNLNLNALAYEYFVDAALIDLANKKGHTQHGLHVANMGGTYLTLIYGLLGIRLNKILTLSPVCPLPISDLQIKILYQGVKIRFILSQLALTIETDKSIMVEIYGEKVVIDGLHSVLIKNS